MKYTFNDGMGNRSRSCRHRVLFQGKAYTQSEAVAEKLAVFRELKYTKNGKWSNTDWEVTVGSARLVVCMSPFDGWPQTLAGCLEHVQKSCARYLGEENTPTTEESVIFFRATYPDKYNEIAALDAAEGELK
jgi:hypothetical protein